MGNSKDHITICSTSYHEYDRRLIRIATAMHEAGYAVTWISRSLDKSGSTSSFINHKFISTFFKRGPLFYLEFNLRLFFKLIFSSRSVINAVDLDTIPACYFASKLKRSPLVHDAHEIFYEVPELTGKKLKKQLWKSTARFFLPKIKYNYTVNHSLAKHYQENYLTDYSVVRNLPIPKNESKLKTNNKTLVYLGVLNQGRGLEIAIETLKKLPHYKLLLVGEGDMSGQLREQAKGLENVIFCGYTEPDKIHKYLDEAAIGLNMLVAHSLNYKLSLANKFFDYMHAGLPSINMAYPEYLHILEEHEVGLTVSDYNSAALGAALTQLENPDHYQRLHANCIAYKDRYSWSNEKEKLIQLYKSLA